MSIGLKNLLNLSIFITFTYTYTLPVYAKNVQQLDVTINDTKGDIEIMLPNTFEWVPAPAEGGVMFSEGTQIRTGPFSRVSLVFADSSIVIVDSFTYMTVEKFFKSGNVVTTRLNLIVGSIVNTLNDGTQYESDYKIVTPSITTSLNRGEIKKVVSGAMYSDTVRTGYKNKEKKESTKKKGTGYKKQKSAGQIALEQQSQRESSAR